MGGGAVTEQIELMLLEAIFHLASGTVKLGMEPSGTDGLGGEGGDHKMPSWTIGIVGEFTDQATRHAPGVLGLIAQRLIPNLGRHDCIEVLCPLCILHYSGQGCARSAAAVAHRRLLLVAPVPR